MSDPKALRDHLVNFRVCDVYLPAPEEVMETLYGANVLQGVVLDITTGSFRREAFAVIRVEGMGRCLIVPVEKIIGVL